MSRVTPSLCFAFTSLWVFNPSHRAGNRLWICHANDEQILCLCALTGFGCCEGRFSWCHLTVVMTLWTRGFLCLSQQISALVVGGATICCVPGPWWSSSEAIKKDLYCYIRRGLRNGECSMVGCWADAIAKTKNAPLSSYRNRILEGIFSTTH